MDYIERIEELRQKEGINKKEFAIRVGLAPKTYYEYIVGKRPLPMYLIPQIADYFGVSPEVIIEGEKYEESDFPVCRQKMYGCKFLCNGVHCSILIDTYFPRECPFYKPK
jgi:transcriptional regulator with XRE-family HTH domain